MVTLLTNGKLITPANKRWLLLNLISYNKNVETEHAVYWDTGAKSMRPRLKANCSQHVNQNRSTPSRVYQPTQPHKLYTDVVFR